MRKIRNVDSYVFNDDVHLLNINNKGIKVKNVQIEIIKKKVIKLMKFLGGKKRNFKFFCCDK